MIDIAFVNEVRLRVLEIAGQTGEVRDAGQVARSLQCTPADVEKGLPPARRRSRVRPRARGRVPPQDGEPILGCATQFRVETDGRRYFGNCIWDAVGIVSLFRGDGTVLTQCPDCGDTQELSVVGRRLVSGEGLVHFGAPAKHWWDDIIHP